MKPQFSFLPLQILFLGLTLGSVAQADTFYRETFNFCDSPSPSASAVAGWKALLTGKPEGKPTVLKIQIKGSNSKLPAVNSNPAGPTDGAGYWNRQSKGLLLYSSEISFDVSTLNSAVWRQRVDRQDTKLFPAYGARLALLIGGTWYISDYSAVQGSVGAFERKEVDPTLLTYGTTPAASGVGIAAPLNSGVPLPTSGTVTAFGLFFKRNFGKVRIDDFALGNSAPAGTNLPDHTYEGCGISTDDNTEVDINETTTECSDGIDNDGDGLVDMNDHGCKSTTDTSEAGGIPPAAPSGVNATDGSSPLYVRVTWTPVTGAAIYRIYRSPISQTSGDLIADNQTTPDYKDHSAVPGVTYFYWVTALNEFGDESEQSNVDTGYRFAPNLDTDGDGVTDNQESIDGTAANDPGSFQLHLKSPAFTKYNTYLRQWNFLELGASGTKPITATVTVLGLDGGAINSTTVTIPARTQQDLDINDLLAKGCAANPAACANLSDIDKSGLVDTYGIVQIDFNDFTTDPGASLIGRMSNYRPNPDGQTFSFAFARELRNPTHGITYAGSNTHDPQGLGNLVPNWLEISNLDSQTRDFDYYLWAQDGSLVAKKTVTVPPLGERDLEAGHQVLDSHGNVQESVYLVEVRPDDGAASYFATVGRYSSNSPAGFAPDTYNFAFALDALAGNGTTQYAPISNLSGNCFTQSNWLEVVNVTATPIVANVAFRNSDGQPLSSSGVLLAPKSQYHFNASALLAKNGQGVAEINGSNPGSLITQSLVYYHDCESNKLETAYAVQGRAAGQDVQQGSVNTFLDVEDELYLIAATPNASIVSATLKSFDPAAVDATADLALGGSGENATSLSNGGALNIDADQYGALVLQSPLPHIFTGGVLRIRTNPDGRIDFVMPTAVQ